MNPSLRRLALLATATLGLTASVAAYGFVQAPRAALSLSVRDERGEPVSEARVSIVSTRSFLGIARSASYRGQTSRDGRASFDAVDAGILHVQVEKPGFDDYEISYWHAGETGAEIRMRRTPANRETRGVELLVSDAGDGPVEEATVVLSGEWRGRRFNFEGVTDARGRALFPFAPPGLVHVSIRKTGVAPLNRAFVVDAGESLAVRLSP